MAEIPKSIWLVEDEQTYVDSMSYILNNTSGLRCKKHYGSSEDLLGFINSPLYTQAPDLILMDIQLPGMSGIETVRKLVELMPGIPVVMMTMFGDRQTIVEAMKAGAVGYIVKGDPYDQIVDVIPHPFKSVPGVLGNGNLIVHKIQRILNGVASQGILLAQQRGQSFLFDKIKGLVGRIISAVVTGLFKPMHFPAGRLGRID